MKKLILIRSASGGGKSYLASQLAKEAVAKDQSVVIHNTDSVWISKTNQVQEDYYFDFNFLYQAHQINQAKTEVSLKRGIDIGWDSNYLYVAVGSTGANSILRTALSGF